MKEIISNRRLREFGLLVGFGFPLLIGWLLPAFVGHGFRAWTILIGVPAFIIGLTSPRLLHYPYKSWIKEKNQKEKIFQIDVKADANQPIQK